MKCIVACFASLFLLMTSSAQAAVVEEIVQVPVTAKGVWHNIENHPMTVTVFRDDVRTELQPFVVINHGRSDVNAPSSNRSRYAGIARHLVAKGYAAFMPTRPGYGITGGPDAEEADTSKYPQVEVSSFAAVAAVEQAISYVKAQSFVAPDKGVLIGQSVGGFVSTLVAAKNIPGILGVVNFAGGRGGNPGKSPGRSTRPDIVESLYKDAGKTSTQPTLWLYSENDKYWGADVPRDWFKSFSHNATDGKDEFVSLPPFKEDGHQVFTCLSCWKEHFERFEKKIGL